MQTQTDTWLSRIVKDALAPINPKTKRTDMHENMRDISPPGGWSRRAFGQYGAADNGPSLGLLPRLLYQKSMQNDRFGRHTWTVNNPRLLNKFDSPCHLILGYPRKHDT